MIIGRIWTKLSRTRCKVDKTASVNNKKEDKGLKKMEKYRQAYLELFWGYFMKLLQEDLVLPRLLILFMRCLRQAGLRGALEKRMFV